MNPNILLTTDLQYNKKDGNEMKAIGSMNHTAERK